MSFFDGQNVVHGARRAFDRFEPEFNPLRLSTALCDRAGWLLAGVRFYTGVPSERDDPAWRAFWTTQLGGMRNCGVHTFSRPVAYRSATVVCPVCGPRRVRVGAEKGIDVRIALDIVRLALDEVFDVALVFSQDQDLTEAIEDVRRVADLQNRWIKVACAFPDQTGRGRGIERTDWIRIDRTTWEACLDPNARPPASGRASET